MNTNAYSLIEEHKKLGIQSTTELITKLLAAGLIGFSTVNTILDYKAGIPFRWWHILEWIGGFYLISK